MAEVLMAVERNREAQNAVLQQIAASVAATAAHIAQGAGGGGHHATGGLAEFQRTQPPVFTRSDDPLDADDWLRTIERKLTSSPYRPPAAPPPTAAASSIADCRRPPPLPPCTVGLAEKGKSERDEEGREEGKRERRLMWPC
nr:hypothetical protein [Oryza sativa Japonica Group]